MFLDLNDNFEIDWVCSVDEAFKKLDAGYYDVVVSDYEMPIKDGLQFLKELRNRKNDIPFILFTGKGREEVAIKALNLGASGYYNKQGSPETVYGELAHGIKTTVHNNKAVKAFVDAKNYAEMLLETANAMIVVLDQFGKIKVFNAAAEEITGYTQEELEGRNWFETIVPKDHYPEVWREFDRLLKSGLPKNFENPILTKSGEERYILWRNNEIREQDKILGTISYGIDITERKKMVTILEKSEAKHHIISDLIADVAFSCVRCKDEGFVIDWMTGNAEKVFGYSVEDILKHGCWKFTVDRQDLPIFEEKVVGLNPGQCSICDLRIISVDGSKRWIRVHSRMEEDRTDPKIHRLFGGCEDITERKRAEEGLRKSLVREKFLADLIRNASIAVSVSYPDGKLSECNSAFEKLTGYNELELKSIDWITTLTPFEFRSFEKEKLEELKRTNEPVTYEKEYIRKDGSRVPIEMTVHPFFDETGKISKYFAFINDITERKRTEETLRKSEAKFRDFADSLPEIVFEMDATGNLTYCNRSAVDLFGYSEENILTGLNVFGLIHPKDLVRAKQNFRLLLSGVQSDGNEYTLVRKDNTPLEVMIIVKPIVVENRVVELRGIGIDVTESKRVDAERAVTFRLLESASQGIDAGLAVINKNYQVVWANKLLMDLGIEPNRKCYEVFNNLGVVCPDCGVERVFKHNASLDVHEYKTVNSKGETVWVELRVTPLKDEKGQVIAAVELAVPITERKQTEEHRKILENKLKQYSEHLKYLVDLRTAQLKDTNQRLVKSERLATIGELSAMIGHDLRNPLAGIKNATFYLKKKGLNISEAQYSEMLETIDKSISHSDKIINDLLEYSREMHLDFEEITIHSLLDKAIKMVHIPDRIQVLNHIYDNTTIRVDSDKIIRIFVNLIRNAIDAMPEKGTLKITSCKTKNHIEIAFTDTGTGITKETLEKLFTPLFTTKAQGMGFGLAICKRMIEAHEGNITVKTTINHGTTFTITLPTKPTYPLKTSKNCSSV